MSPVRWNQLHCVQAVCVFRVGWAYETKYQWPIK